MAFLRRRGCGGPDDDVAQPTSTSDSLHVEISRQGPRSKQPTPRSEGAVGRLRRVARVELMSFRTSEANRLLPDLPGPF